MKMIKNMKFDDTEIEEYKFHQSKVPTLTNDGDINEIAVCNRFLLVSIILNISLVTKVLKELDIYAYFIHKWLYIKNFLMKIDV